MHMKERKPPDSLDEHYEQKNTSGIDVSLTQIGVAIAIVFAVVNFGGLLMATNVDLIETQPEQIPVEFTTDNSTTNAEAVYKQTAPSVVTIYTRTGNEMSTQGTGFVYNENGHVLTNYHVVSGSVENLYVKYHDDTWAKADKLGEDPHTDLAVIDPHRDETPPPLQFRYEKPDVGETVHVIGSPRGLDGSLTSGVVSGNNRTSPSASNYVVPDMIQIEASLNQGNSGGPIIDETGAVIGVARATSGENLGFGVSADMVRAVVPELIEYGDIQHPLVGVTTVEMTPHIAAANGVEYVNGVGVTGVQNDSSLNGTLQVGNTTVTYQGEEIVDVGDIITHVDDKRITSNERFASVLLKNYSPGDTVELTIVRNGDTQTISAKLNARPTVSY